MKRYIKELFLFVVLFGLTGCSMLETNTSLMAPPTLPDTKEEILHAIEQYVPNSQELLIPLNDKRTNPIIMEDLDGDGKEEAIVFYKKKPGILTGVVLKDMDGWKQWVTFDSGGKVLHDLKFFDLTGDGKKEVFIGTAYTKEYDSSRVLYVYQLDDEAERLLEEACHYFITDDFGPTGPALILVTFNKGKNNTLTMYQTKDMKLTVTDTLALDEYINGYEHLISGRITPSTWGLMLDVGIGAHSGATFVISIQNGKMENVFPHGEDDPTFKASMTYSNDTNRDGILEFSVLEEPVVEKDLSHAEMPYITAYYQLTDAYEQHLVSKRFDNDTYNYQILLPLKWKNIKINMSDDWKYVEMIDAKTDQVLFDVYVSEIKRIEDDWTLLKETDQYVYLSKTVNEKNKHLFQFIHDSIE